MTVATEHRAVLDPCRRLEKHGVRLTVLNPTPDGLLNLRDIEHAFTKDTVLLSVMAANNELGVLQPIAEIGALALDRGILFHTDAAQAVGKVRFSTDDVAVDLASISAHKMYGPKEVGALYVRRRRPRLALEPLIDGGDHERGLRSGTSNVPGIVGFGRAAEICQQEMAIEGARTQMLHGRLLAGLERRLSDIRVNGTMERRLPHNLNVSFAGLEGESLLVGIDDVAISSGAACSSATPEPSHVLRAIGVPDDLARASIRFWLGRWTTAEEIDYTVDKFSSLVIRLRQLSPLSHA